MQQNKYDWAIGTVVLIVVAALIAGLLSGVYVGYKTLARSQRVRDAKMQRELIVLTAKNQAVVNTARIAQTKQMVQVEIQQARIRVEEAKGIAQAQHIINATLSPQYLQHEAIQAQSRMADSKNHTTVYIPSGNNGIPLVNDIGGGTAK